MTQEIKSTRIAITSNMDEGNVVYFDSVNELDEWIRERGQVQGGDRLARIINNQTSIEDRCAIVGYTFNGETNGEHWVGRAIWYLSEKSDLDNFEQKLIEGLNDYIFSGDKGGMFLRDLFINGPLPYNEVNTRGIIQNER